MSDKYILDANGDPVPEPDLVRWANWFEAASEIRGDGQSGRHVALSLRGQVKISTVFLGLDHGYPGQPQLFETMVFDPACPDEHCDRYATRAEAMAGHQQWVELVEITSDANQPTA